MRLEPNPERSDWTGDGPSLRFCRSHGSACGSGRRRRTSCRPHAGWPGSIRRPTTDAALPRRSSAPSPRGRRRRDLPSSPTFFEPFPPVGGSQRRDSSPAPAPSGRPLTHRIAAPPGLADRFFLPERGM